MKWDGPNSETFEVANWSDVQIPLVDGGRILVEYTKAESLVASICMATDGFIHVDQISAE